MSSRRLRSSRTRKLRVEQLCQRQLLAGDMTNPGNSLDVNNDSFVRASDALAIINYMAMESNVAEGEDVSAAAAVYPDTNGDSKVTASDALRVINNLEGEQVSPPAPDLVIRSASIGSVNEEFAQFNVQVGNDGTALTEGQSVLVSVLVGSDIFIPGGSASGSTTVNLSGATANATISVPIGNLDAGEFGAQVAIDPIDAVDETDESNNGLQLNTPVVVGGNIGGGQLFGLIVDPGNSPRIKFSATDMAFVVTTPNPGFLEFTETANNTSQVLSIKDGLKIQVIGVNNRVILDGAVIPDDLNVEIVDGTNNVIELINTFVGDDFIYRGNGGRDEIFMDNGTVIADRVDIKTKGGDDAISLRGARIGDDFILHAGDGFDFLDVRDTLIGDDAVVRMEDHNDTVVIQNSRVADVADIKGNSGFDTFLVDNNSSAGKLRVDGFEAFEL